MASAKPIAAPLSVSGLNAPLANALTKAAAKAGRPVLAVPAGPLGSFPPQTLQPGSAVAVGYSNGDVRTSATGTVAYVDGDRIWIFGHELEGNGRRALLLQDAYVYKIINNPLQIGSIASTYKLAASGHDLGTVTNDSFSAVAGHLGVLPHTVPIQVIAEDQDAKKRTVVNTSAADEAAVDLPSGGSWTSAIAPLAVTQGISSVLGSVPGRLTGSMCARITRGRDQEAAALLQPLRVGERRPERGRRRRRTRCSAAPPTTSARRWPRSTPTRARPRTSPASTCSPASIAAPTRRSSARSRCLRGCGRARRSRSRSRCRSSAARSSTAPTR